MIYAIRITIPVEKFIGTVKTTIFIDAEVLKQVDQLSKALHISRGSFFSQAAQYMIERDGNQELLKRINATAVCQNKEDILIKKQKEYTQKKLTENW